MSASPAPIHVTHQPQAHRFEAEVEGQRAEIEYELEGSVMSLTHTRVPAALEGRGIAGQLTKAALEHARAAGWKVKPVCSYAVGYFKRHPDVADLLA